MTKKRLCFLGKRSIRNEEALILETLGMGIALSGYDLLTLPGLAASNDAVAKGAKTIDPNGVFDLRKQKGISEDEINSYDWVIYPDDDLLRQLDKRAPFFWGAPNWINLPTLTALQIFTEAMLAHLGDAAVDERVGGLPSR